MYAALRILAPGVERLAFTVDPRRDSIPIVKISSIDEPFPIRSLGNGMMRVLSMALALVNLQDGMLLIDEFENGLYYSIQPDIWRLIFQVARRLNVWRAASMYRFLQLLIVRIVLKLFWK